jgi:L-alanine-DL-glutamate epimerase-like enolase superfamily enzyme
MHLQEGRMHVSDRPGLGFSLSEQALRWTTETAEFGKRP